MGFHPGSLVLSASIIREDKEPALCPRAAIEEQRASPIAKQKTLMCFIAPPMHVGISKRLYIAIWLVALPDISNNVGPVKLFLKTLLSFHLKEFFSFVFLSFSFFSASTTTARL
jgi:hypothetical protein